MNYFQCGQTNEPFWNNQVFVKGDSISQSVRPVSFYNDWKEFQSPEANIFIQFQRTSFYSTVIQIDRPNHVGLIFAIQIIEMSNEIFIWNLSLKLRIKRSLLRWIDFFIVHYCIWESHQTYELRQVTIAFESFRIYYKK